MTAVRSDTNPRGSGSRALTAAGLALIGVAVLLALGFWLLGSDDDSDGRAPAAVKGLAWARPKLAAPETVKVSADDRSLELDPGRDYRIELPAPALRGPGGLAITGGHNVELVGGTIEIPRQGRDATIEDRRGLLLRNQTGTVHVEGLLITGAGLTEGIDLDQPRGAIVQLENIRVDEVRARDERRFSDNHPDVIQTWAGPAELRIDRLTGVTDYQGIFLQPEQIAKRPPRLVDIRRVNIVGTRTARYLLWQASPFAKSVRDVWVSPPAARATRQSMWPTPAKWKGVTRGKPPQGDFVPRGSVGAGYGR